jgi:hypothetical protein
VPAQGDLVELAGGDARDVGGTVGRPAGLQALEGLAVLGSLGECVAPGVDLRLAAVEVELGGPTLALDALEPRLHRDEVAPAQLGRADGRDVRAPSRVDRLARTAKHGLATQTMREARGELLLRAVLVLLAQRTDALEAEVTGRGHARVIGAGPVI